MDELSVFVPIISLVAGWFLNEMAKKFQMSRERRAHVGRALTNLLELHHQIRAVESTLELIKKSVDLNMEVEAAVRQLIKQILPQSDKYVSSYEDAIAQLSESAPVTAFRLSTNAQIPRFLELMRVTTTVEGSADLDTVTVENQLREILVPHIGLTIKELAKLHGKATQKQVDQMLAAPVVTPEQINNLLQHMQEKNQNQLADTGAEVK